MSLLFTADLLNQFLTSDWVRWVTH